MPAPPSTWASYALQERRFPEAIDAFRRAMEAAPTRNGRLWPGNTLILRGRADEGRAAMASFQKLSESSYAITYSQTYLEQGRYAEAITSTGPRHCARRHPSA